MREKLIRKLIRLVEESDVNELEITSWGRKVRITKRLRSSNGHENQSSLIQAIIPAPAQSTRVSESTPEKAESLAVETEKKYVEIKSPMVGTFYASPAPDAPPYVTQGQRISVGQVVCIVEAMKLMNEIETEAAGTIAKILVENGQPVEFGQVLFLIDPQD
jgi:acetyl-CoA carboxylase biotin carboxyl carrier protein